MQPSSVCYVLTSGTLSPFPLTKSAHHLYTPTGVPSSLKLLIEFEPLSGDCDTRLVRHIQRETQ